MTLRLVYFVVATVFLCSCSDSSENQGMPADSNAAAIQSGAGASSANSYDRKSFVLCPALESHRDELAAIVGFEQNSERALSMSASSRQCFVRGKDGGFIGIEILPAIVSSIEAYADESFDATATEAPEIGPDAMYVEHVSQPRMIFSMGSLLIDVYAEYYAKTPDRDTMVALAARVRDFLPDEN